MRSLANCASFKDGAWSGNFRLRMGWGFWDGGNAVSISSAVLWLKQTIRREATGEDGRTMTHSSRARRERILRIWYAETRTQPLSTDCWKQDSHWLVSIAVYHEHKRLSRTSTGLSFEFWPLISKSVHSKRGEGQHLPSELVYLHRKRKICATFLGKEMIIPEHGGADKKLDTPVSGLESACTRWRPGSSPWRPSRRGSA